MRRRGKGRRTRRQAEGLVRLLMSLEGRHVLGWEGQETALRDQETPDAVLAEFEDPSVPFLQLERLDLELDGDELLAVGTCRASGTFGLWPHVPARRLAPGTQSGVHRTRRLAELPRGRVRSVDARASERGALFEVAFTLEEGPVFLLPGELQEDAEGALRVRLGRDQVLLFTDPADLADARAAAAARAPLAPEGYDQ